MPLPSFPRGAALAAVTASLAALAVPLLTAPALVTPARAQSEDPFRGVRAINLARNHAVRLNGGLGLYRPAACMFSTDARGEDCLVSRDQSGFLFRFLGGAPGWQQLGLPPTTETEILIGPDGRSVVEVLYNGTPRGQAGAASGTPEETRSPVEPSPMPVGMPEQVGVPGQDYGQTDPGFGEAPPPPETGTF